MKTGSALVSLAAAMAMGLLGQQSRAMADAGDPSTPRKDSASVSATVSPYAGISTLPEGGTVEGQTVVHLKPSVSIIDPVTNSFTTRIGGTVTLYISSNSLARWYLATDDTVDLHLDGDPAKPFMTANINPFAVQTPGVNWDIDPVHNVLWMEGRQGLDAYAVNAAFEIPKSTYFVTTQSGIYSNDVTFTLSQ